MRRIFDNVPVIYGFSSVAPLGPKSAALLGRYLQPSAIPESATAAAARGCSRLRKRIDDLGQRPSRFGSAGATSREVCSSSTIARQPADKLVFIHELLGRDMAEVRIFLDRIEALLASLTPADRTDPRFVEARAAIARDTLARGRLHALRRGCRCSASPRPMIQLAAKLGWLSEAEMHAELVRMIGDLIGRDAIGPSEVDLICGLNKDHALDGERGGSPWCLRRRRASPMPRSSAAWAVPDGRARVLQALTGGNDAEVRIAEVFLVHRPIEDVAELRDVASGIARMPGSASQIRALDTLGRHRLRDRETLAELASLFPIAQNIDVQRAIAALLIRSDYQLLPKPEMENMLSQYRLKSTGGTDAIDILLRRLQSQ
jgi:hypothetical protein